jgi:hypothetical protein
MNADILKELRTIRIALDIICIEAGFIALVIAAKLL